MTNLKTRLLRLGKLFVASLAIAALLLIAGRDLFTLISPLMLLAFSAVGALLLIGVVALLSWLGQGAASKGLCRSAAQGK